MDISILLEDGTHKAYGGVEAVILLEDHSWVLGDFDRVESDFRIQIDDAGDSIGFSGFAYAENLGRLKLPKRAPRY